MPIITFSPIEATDNQKIADLIRAVFQEFHVDMPGTVYTDPTTGLFSCNIRMLKEH